MVRCHDDANGREQHGRRPFSDDDLGSGDWIDQQGLERATLAFSGSGIDGDLHAAEERRHNQEHRQHVHDARGHLLGRGEIHFFQGDGVGELGAHSSSEEAEGSDGLVEFEQHPSGFGDGTQ